MLIAIKFMRVMLSKFSKITLKKLQTGGRAPDAPALDPPLKSHPCLINTKVEFPL